MEVSLELKIAARGWHVYGKTIWQSPRKEEKLMTEKEKSKEAYRSVCCCLDTEKKE